MRPEAIEFNLESAFNSFRALGMLAPPAPSQEGDPLSGATTELRDWNDAFLSAVDEVVAWCFDHDMEFWRAEELEQRWKAMAVDAIWRGGGGSRPPQGLERAVDALIEFVVGWRVLREVEVWEGLVSDGGGDWDLLGV